MIHKVFSGSRYGGRNLSAKSLVKYLTRDKISVEAMAQVGVRLLRGDIVSCLEIAESLPFKQKYFSGCLSFEEQNLPDEIKEKIMQSYEEVIFTGIEEQYRQMAWVEHTDKGRLELNFFMPCVDMATGNSFKPYYHQADQYLIKRWQTLINHEYNLTDPDDNPRPNLTPLWKFKDGKGSDNEVRNKIIEKVSRVCVSMMLQGGNREDFVKALENNTDYRVKRNKKGELSDNYLTLILSAESEEGRQYQLKKELRVKLEGELYKSDTDIQSPSFINRLLSIAQQLTQENHNERLFQTTRASVTADGLVNRPAYYRVWQPNQFTNPSEIDEHQKRHSELFAAFCQYLAPRTARHEKRYGERHPSAFGGASKRFESDFGAGIDKANKRRKSSDYDRVGASENHQPEHRASIGLDGIKQGQLNANGGNTGAKSSQNQENRQNALDDNVSLADVGAWYHSTPIDSHVIMDLDRQSEQPKGDTSQRERGFRATSNKTIRPSERLAGTNNNAKELGHNTGFEHNPMGNLHAQEKQSGRAILNHLQLSPHANEHRDRPPKGYGNNQISVGGIYGLSDTDVEQFNHYAQRFAQRKRETQQREQGTSRAHGVVGATKQRIAKTKQRIVDTQRQFDNGVADQQAVFDELATAGEQLQAGIGAVENDCVGLKQRIDGHRREFVGLGNVCYVDGEGNRHPMSHKDKEDYADGTPVLELVKTTKRLKRERELENTPRFGR